MGKMNKRFEFDRSPGILLLCLLASFTCTYAAPDGSDYRTNSSFSFPASSATGFIPSATLDEPIYATHPQIDEHSHELPNHLRHEHPPVPLEKSPKLQRDGKAFSLDKSPPELQFGVSFTVPFMSLSTESLVNTLTGKSFGDPYSDVSSLLKLNVGGLIVAAVVGLAALLFVPSIFPGKLPGLFSGGFPGTVPTFIDQLMPGFFNKPYYDHPYDPYPSDYAGSGSSYKNDGTYEGRGRALKRGTNVTAAYTQVFSTIRNAINNYWGEMESCAFHAMCLRGKHASEEKLKKSAGLKSHRHSRRPDGSPVDESDSLSSFEHILEAIEGMQGITKNMPIFHDLNKAYRSGQNGRDCTEEYKACPVTPDGISKALTNVGNYIFSNNN